MRIKLKIKNNNSSMSKNDTHYDKYISKYWDEIYTLPDVEVDGYKVEKNRFFIRK